MVGNRDGGGWACRVCHTMVNHKEGEDVHARLRMKFFIPIQWSPAAYLSDRRRSTKESDS